MEIRCILKTLKILNRGKSKYSLMFKETKVSHTTLQHVLKELAEKEFIKRVVIDHMIVDYEINDRGKILLNKLGELKNIVQ